MARFPTCRESRHFFELRPFRRPPSRSGYCLHRHAYRRVLLNINNEAFAFGQYGLFAAFEPVHQRERRQHNRRGQQRSYNCRLGRHFAAVALAGNPLLPPG